MNAILNDYVTSQRYMTFYVVDCERIECDERLQKLSYEINRRYSDKLYVTNSKEIDQEMIINRVESILNTLFDDNHSDDKYLEITGDLNDVFAPSI
jgi:hypothetical protein